MNDCWHCYLRRLNYVWGQELRPLDVERLEKQLTNGLNNPNPKSSLAYAMKQKKTIRFGNKADPFQESERHYHVSEQVLNILSKLQWSVLIQTMCTEIMMHYINIIVDMKSNAVVQAIISPGAESDWAILERKRTTPVQDRIDHLVILKQHGISVGVNGEPFIPGYHTVEQFADLVKRLKTYGIHNYNTYNFHFNDFIAKRLLAIGIDIEKIWYYNQDTQWKLILQQLIDIAKESNIVLGCPDFVNSGKGFKEQANTCCGIDVPNPTTYNCMTWKRRIQAGEDPIVVLESSFDGVGDCEDGKQAFFGLAKDKYTMSDAGFEFLPKRKKGLFV